MGDSRASAHADPGRDAHALPKGTRLAEFEIEGVLGIGGFGVVYRALDHSLHRQVAIKEYLPGSLAHRDGTRTIVPHSEEQRETFEAGLRSFMQEARLLARFDHPALVKVYRFWEAHGTAYIATAYYEGVTLKSAYASERPTQEEIVTLLAPLLDAVEVMHRAHCYHRDIAPDNIIVQPDGSPVLLDFGAARRVIGEMTQALTVVLKSGYAPIEQYAEDGTQAQGPWTDVYALAATVHWMIRGKSPPASVMRVVGQDPYVPLARDPVAGFDGAFLSGLDRALSIRPEARPQSIAALREALGIAVTKAAPVARSIAVAQVAPEGETTVLAPHPRDVARRKEQRRNVAVFSVVVAAVTALTVLVLLNVLGPVAPEPKVVASNRVEVDQLAQPGSGQLAPPREDPPRLEPAAPGATAVPAGSPPSLPPPLPAVKAPAPAAAPPPAAARTTSPPVAPAAKTPPAPPAITDPKEQYELARNLQRGKGVEKNPSEAIAWLRRSADQGYARAQLALGAAYESGNGVPQDSADAFGWYKRAAVQGNVDAQVKVAQYYRDGVGVSKDTQEALLWYGKAAEKGNAEAKDSIARLLPSPKAAATKEASVKTAPSSAPVPTSAPSPSSEPVQVAKASQGSTPKPSAAPAPKTSDEQYELGLDYRLGRKGVAVNLPEAARWYRAAAEQGHAAAQDALGYMYQYGQGVAVDYAEARKWFEKSVANGNANALNNMGRLYGLGQGVKQNDVLAADYYRRAADAGNAWGMRNLAWSLENGRGVFRDLPAAIDLYRKSASAGNTDAMFQLGRLYERGDGVKKDESEALRWYRMAATGGHKDAARRVELAETARK